MSISTIGGLLVPFCEGAITNSVSDCHVKPTVPKTWKVRNVERERDFGPCEDRTKIRPVNRRAALRTWTRWVSLMTPLRPCCLTDTSLRTFIVRAGLNEQAFERTVVQDWPNSQYNTSSSGSGTDEDTLVLQNTDAYLPTHTESHPVKKTVMNAFPFAIYMQLVRAGRRALVGLSFVSIETERKYCYQLQLLLRCPLWALSKFLLNILNINHQCTVKV